MKSYQLQRFGLFSLFKLGVLFGLLLSLLPAILLTNLAFDLFRVLDALLWTVGGFMLSGELERTVNFLHNAAAAGLLEIVGVIIILVVVVAVYHGLVFMLSGLIFNVLVGITGGLEMSMVESPAGSGFVPGGQVVPVPAPMQQQTVLQQPAVAQQAATRLEVSQPYPQTLPIRYPVNMIGSAANCHIRLDGLQPVHFQIARQNDRVILKDLTQGQLPVYVQGHIVQGENLLKDGFVIQVSHYQMTYRDR